MLKNDLNQYIIGVSGGPDSMALLDMMHKNKYQLVVVHINYNMRDSAMRDQKIVEEYCQTHGIICHVFDFDEPEVGNFQSQAREFRYRKFKEVCDQYQCHHIAIAQHLDDCVETFIWQNQRRSQPRRWGIEKESYQGKYCIVRPLIDIDKNDIMKYIEKMHLNYGIDESNLSDKYTRNKIRHHEVEMMTKQEKLTILEQINTLNKQIAHQEMRLAQIKQSLMIDFDEFEKRNDKAEILRSWFINQPSNIWLMETIKQLASKNRVIIEYDNKLLIKEYHQLKYVEKPHSYCYVYNGQKIDSEYFEIVNNAGSFNCATICANEFPLIIRNYKQGDKIKMNYGTKKLSRWFIDNKIDYIARMQWPVVINKFNEVVMVVGIGCSFKHYSNNPNFYMIK